MPKVLQLAKKKMKAVTRMRASKGLSDLPDQLSSLIFGGAELRRLAAGQTLFRAGDVGDGCYRLEQGLVKVAVTSPRGEERIIGLLGAGAIIGELATVDGQPRSASITAIRDCELLFLSQEAFENAKRAHPDVCQHLVTMLAARLREADETLAATSFLTVKGRVARAMLELADYLGQDSGDGRVTLSYKISQGDLAAMAGVARENVSRTLSEWRRRKLVTLSSQYYCLNDPAALAREIDVDGS